MGCEDVECLKIRVEYEKMKGRKLKAHNELSIKYKNAYHYWRNKTKKLELLLSSKGINYRTGDSYYEDTLPGGSEEGSQTRTGDNNGDSTG